MILEGVQPRRSQAIAASRGRLIARFAVDAEEVAAAKALRDDVFFGERGLVRDAMEGDKFDAHCDHLLVLDGRRIVGTYRLLRQEMASACGFYTQTEFDIAALVARMPRLRYLELGRSCVLKEYRTKPVIEVLWQAIWDYVRGHGVDVMFGCASFEGTDPDRHALPLTYLARTRIAEGAWRVEARAGRRTEMERLPGGEADAKAALRAMPPLIKGYLKLGALVGDGAVVDHSFHTVDVLILLPVERIDPRYFGRFGPP